MKDGLKKAIEENRKAFDIYETDYNEIWPVIEKRIEKGHGPRRTLWFVKIAAAILVLAFTSMVFLRLQPARGYVSDELSEAEAQYIPMIDEKITIIKASYPQMDTALWSGIGQIDHALLALRGDLKDQADNEEVIYAMIENYHIKLQILENILEEVKKQNDDVETTNI